MKILNHEPWYLPDGFGGKQMVGWWVEVDMGEQVIHVPVYGELRGKPLLEEAPVVLTEEDFEPLDEARFLREYSETLQEKYGR